MNFTFTWILDKFGFQPKIEIEPIKKPVAACCQKSSKKNCS